MLRVVIHEVIAESAKPNRIKNEMMASAALVAIALLLPGAAVARTDIGWVWESNPGCVNACYGSGYNSNSPGGESPIGIEPMGTGTWRVFFNELAPHGPSNVQVGSGPTTSNGSAYCTTGGWTKGPKRSAAIIVNCFDSSGKPADAYFSVLYQSRDTPLGTSGKGIAFLWADQPTEAGYTPNLDYQYNTTGATNTMVRNGTGNYTAAIPGLTKNGGNVQVTAYGNSPARCKVSNWSASQSGTGVNVLCFDDTGAASDEMFTLLYALDEPLTPYAPSVLKGAYVWANKANNAKGYEPPRAYNYNGFSSGRLSSQKVLTGLYKVTIPDAPEKVAPVSLVTAYGNSNDYCDGGTPESPFFLMCYDQEGNAANSQFDAAYQDLLQQ